MCLASESRQTQADYHSCDYFEKHFGEFKFKIFRLLSYVRKCFKILKEIYASRSVSFLRTKKTSAANNFFIPMNNLGTFFHPNVTISSY